MTTPPARRPRTPRPDAAAKPASPTVARLRELARELGVRGYSRLRKDELERELAARGRIPETTATASPPAATTARGAPAPAQPAATAATTETSAPPTAFTEDIDRLPQARELQLELLPQRPGVVQAYWVLPLDATRSLPPLHLRLLRADTDRDPLIAELPVAAGSGHHYFRLDDDIDPGALYLQLGYYDSSRQFVNASAAGSRGCPPCTPRAATRTPQR